MPQRTLIFFIIVIFIIIIIIVWVSTVNSSSEIYSKSITGIDKPVGVWGPISTSGHNLEQLKGTNQSRAISDIITQGFDEYHFVMGNFKDPKLVDSTESLLQSAENLDNDLKIIIITLPPSEGGPNGNYDWKGWIEYSILSSRGIPTPLKDLLSMISIGLAREMIQYLSIILILWNIQI